MFDLTINDYPISYIAWNMILGIIPFFLCFCMFRLNKTKNAIKYLYLTVLFLLWLVFLPNSSYILTDIRHINGFCPNTIADVCNNNAWMIAFFFFYGLWGWILYFYAIEQMRVFWKRYISFKYSFYFPILVSPVAAIGLLLGLVDRLNSWDLIFRPFIVFKTAFNYLIIFNNFFNLIIFSIVLFFLYYIGKIIFKPIKGIRFLDKLIL